MSSAARRCLLGCVAELAACIAAALPPDAGRTLFVAVCGLTQGYLEPCNCGGQRAGGLARRAAMTADLRREHPDLVLLDIGELLDTEAPGSDPARLPLVTRAMAYLGVDACGLGNRDLARVEAVAAALDEAAVPATVLSPARDVAPPSRRLVEAGGTRLGLVSVTFGSAVLVQLVEEVGTQLRALRTDGAELLVLVSHLGKPAVVSGALWVPVARRGRSLSTIRADRAAAAWRLMADTVAVDEGPVDAASPCPSAAPAIRRITARRGGRTLT